MSSGTWRRRAGTARSRSATLAAQAIREVVRECACLLGVVRLEEARGDLDPEVAFAVLALGEVAKERQERANLPAGEGEVNAVDVFTALSDAKLPHRLQVDAPVPPADHKGSEPLPVQQPPRRLGLQERADRHARLENQVGEPTQIRS
jgi:hypothetical protein